MYCTLDDLTLMVDEVRLIELTDDDGLGVIDQARIDEAISTAQGEVDGYLQERYTVPLDPVPPLIKGACRDIALYNLYSRKYDRLPEVRQKRYDNAVKLLTNVARGTITLGVATPPTETAAETMQVSTPPAIFSADELEKF